jgi:4-hydroxyphenylacetate 3-monooxygenase
MGIRTGQQYLDKLNGMTPEIYVNGEKITSNVAEHPLFRNNARTYATLFDMQHDPVRSDDLTFISPATGELVSTSFLIPRSEADLIRRRKAFSAWTDFSHGFLGRSGDYMNSSLTALASATAFFEKADPVYGERIRAYYELASQGDLLATHTLVPPQVNRSVAASQQAGGQLTAHVVEERSDGVVIRGARLLATIGPIADELLVFPSTVLRGTPEDAPYSFAFAIPNDAPGLKYYCRAPLYHGGNAFDEPLASRFEEMDAVVVFDDVLVPHERVFMLGQPELCNAWYSETGAGALMTHQVVTRTLAKTEFYLGLASEIADTIGISQFQHIQEDVAELVSYVEIERAMLRAAEADGELSEDGVFLPKWSTLNAARNWYPRKVSQRLPEIIRKFSASGLMALPGEADFALAHREGRADLDTYLQAAAATAEQRARLFKLAVDAAVSGFAGRETLYEYFFFGDPVRMASAQVSSYDREPARARVRALLADAGPR